jgi:hypothetical protein
MTNKRELTEQMTDCKCGADVTTCLTRSRLHIQRKRVERRFYRLQPNSSCSRQRERHRGVPNGVARARSNGRTSSYIPAHLPMNRSCCSFSRVPWCRCSSTARPLRCGCRCVGSCRRLPCGNWRPTVRTFSTLMSLLGPRPDHSREGGRGRHDHQHPRAAAEAKRRTACAPAA